MTNILRDVRYGGRMLAKHPGHTVAALLALGLGIGLTTTVFSIDYGALLRGLPFERSDRIMAVYGTNLSQQQDRRDVFPLDYLDLRRRQTSFESLAAYSTGTINLSGDLQPERFDGAFLTADSLGVLRVRPLLGRGFLPGEATQIRDSALCATCHTLYTVARGKGGQAVGELPEQMPYQEWQHSAYAGKSSCQSCHMPEVQGDTPVTSLFGQPRQGARHHYFVGANFLMQRILSNYRQDLSVAALPDELTAASQRTVNFLQSQSARVSIRNVEKNERELHIDVLVENLTGHKLPTAYPSRRVWLHVVIRDRNERTVFESGALNPDGSIQGNDNDADPSRFEPHYREITKSDQVQIYEPILGDSEGHVTTGLLAAVGYLKDNRLLPEGFDKSTAEKDIAVAGDAADDPNFTGKGSVVRYSPTVDSSAGPFHIEVELWYEPIGFRWAHNLGTYQADEPQRLVSYYDSLASGAAVILAKTEATK